MANFIVFQAIYDKLLSRSKRKEFELNSALQIRNQKERRAENVWKLEPAGNLAGLFLHAATLHPATLFMSHAD